MQANESRPEKSAFDDQKTESDDDAFQIIEENKDPSPNAEINTEVLDEILRLEQAS